MAPIFQSVSLTCLCCSYSALCENCAFSAARRNVLLIFSMILNPLSNNGILIYSRKKSDHASIERSMMESLETYSISRKRKLEYTEHHSASKIMHEDSINFEEPKMDYSEQCFSKKEQPTTQTNKLPAFQPAPASNDGSTKIPLTSGEVIEHFEVIGCGLDVLVKHQITNQFWNIRVIDSRELDNIRKVVARLRVAHDHYRRADFYECRDMLFPRESKVIQQSNGRILLVSPLYHRTLHSKVHKLGDEMSEYHIHHFFIQIVKLLNFCHSIGIIVREVKPRRLVFTDKCQLSIRLFNVADVIVCDDIQNTMIVDKFGSPAYVPPEVLSSKCKAYDAKKADMWSLGVVLYLLLFRRYPFYGQSLLRVFQLIKKAVYQIPVTSRISRFAKAILISLICRNPDKRPSASEVLHMPWPCPSTNSLFCITYSPTPPPSYEYLRERHVGTILNMEAEHDGDIVGRLR